jgi:3-dehydroquinate synthase
MNVIQYHHTSIYVGASWDMLSRLVDLDNYSKVILLIDENVYRLWEKRFVDYLFIILPSGEKQKSLAVVEKLVQDLIDLDADRKTLLVGVGGGVTCDIAGFIGAIYMRGIEFGLVPTTLLAQVDASIGGKNGVNTGDHKNMIGTIVQPKFVLADKSFIATLPDVEFNNGMAEVIKHGCILDHAYFSFIESQAAKIITKDSAALDFIIQRSVELKMNVVANDPLEGGQRKLLNFGHTFGHALEKKYNLPHGYAVSLGINIVNNLMVSKGELSAVEAMRIRKLLSVFGLPIDCENYSLNELLPLVLHDKKRASDTLQLITLKEIGEGIITPIKIDDLRLLL